MVYWKSSVHLFELSKKGLVGKLEALSPPILEQYLIQVSLSLSLSRVRRKESECQRESERATEGKRSRKRVRERARESRQAESAGQV
jgi:hypothetical protein